MTRLRWQAMRLEPQTRSYGREMEAVITIIMITAATAATITVLIMTAAAEVVTITALITTVEAITVAEAITVTEALPVAETITTAAIMITEATATETMDQEIVASMMEADIDQTDIQFN